MKKQECYWEIAVMFTDKSGIVKSEVFGEFSDDMNTAIIKALKHCVGMYADGEYDTFDKADESQRKILSFTIIDRTEM